MPSRDEYCPVAKAVEILGDRWTVLLVRELLRGVRGFNELERSVPGISRSILASRLRTLESSGIVIRDRSADAGSRQTAYRLSGRGRDLEGVVMSLSDWGTRWLVPRERATPVDPDGLMLWIRRHVVLDALPARRVVVAFELLTPDPRRWWLVLRPGDVTLCPEHPGFAEDLILTATPETVYELFVGRLAVANAIAAGSLAIDGPPNLVRALPTWFRLAPGGRRTGSSAVAVAGSRAELPA